MTLEEARKSLGKKVTYRPYPNCKTNLMEHGIISDISSRYVFVRYGSDHCCKATNATDLTLDKE